MQLELRMGGREGMHELEACTIPIPMHTHSTAPPPWSLPHLHQAQLGGQHAPLAAQPGSLRFVGRLQAWPTAGEPFTVCLSHSSSSWAQKAGRLDR